MKQVEFWFDFASSYSYPAALRVEEVARAESVPIVWRPFLLGPIFKAQGWHDSPFNIYPAKGNYMWRDLERLCESLRMPFRKPSIFPRNGVLAASLACLFSAEPWMPEFVRHMFPCELRGRSRYLGPFGACVGSRTSATAGEFERFCSIG
jgi:2-hydroxychromene-2-carboxylate isomerase